MMIALLLTALAQDPIDNPEFTGWSSFKPGSSVTYKVESEGRDQSMDQRVTLKSVDEKELVLVTEISVNGKVLGKATERKIEAKIPAADAGKRLKDGEEEIEAGGKKFKCRWVEIEKTASNDKKVNIKVWANDDVPGHAVRIEMSMGGGGKATMVYSASETK
jgi:hypothetical protein